MALYWRSLLQVVLLQKVGDVSDMAHVGRIAAKCRNFTEYARAAFIKLKIDMEVCVLKILLKKTVTYVS